MIVATQRLIAFALIFTMFSIDFIGFSEYLFCKETVKYPLVRGDIVYYVGEKTAEIREGDSYTDLILSRVPGIDGKSVRMYLLPPHITWFWNMPQVTYARIGIILIPPCITQFL